MSTQNSEKPKKTKKSDLAFSIYNKHLPKRETMKKREFRALVIEDMKVQLGVENKGTLGMYFAWSEQVVTGRAAKVYSRGDGSRARKGAKQNDKLVSDLNQLANELSRAAAKKRDSGDQVTTEFKPKGGFGTASF